MSLINDALKRAQNNTDGDLPPRLGAEELRPIDAGQPPSQRSGGNRLVIGFVVFLVLLGNVALFLLFRAVKTKQVVSARTVAEQFEATPAEGLPNPDVGAVEAPAPALEQVVEADPAPEAQSATTIVPDLPEPDRSEFMLKTIVVHPTRPSAMINNRVVFVGDKVSGYTVVAIGADAVILRLDDDEVRVSLP